MDKIANVTFRFSVVLILLATCASTYAQTVATGTWRVGAREFAPLPWEVFLRADGPRLTGNVTNCGPGGPTPEISEGHIDGNIITFKCTTPDRVSKLAFTGRLDGDELAFTWELQAPDGAVPPPWLDASVPTRFTAKRVPDNPTGTWRVDGVGGAVLWEVTLKTDGPRLTGAVSSCSSNRGAIEIYEGKADGGAITFKCRGLNRASTLILTGRMNGAVIAFTWEKQVQDDGTKSAADDALFGPSAQPQFAAKRVPEGRLLNTDEKHGFVRGSEFAAAVNLVSEDVKAEATIFIPEGVTRVRAMLMAVEYGLGFEVFYTPRWPELAKTFDGALLLVRFTNIEGIEMGNAGVRTTSEDGRADVLLAVLRRLAQESGHPELNEAPLLFWGHSFSAGVASIFAERFADRTLGFVRYHGGSGPMGDLNIVGKIPALFVAAGENPGDVADSEALWRSGRGDGGPWTLVVEPKATHADLSENIAGFMVDWIEATLRQRLPLDGASLRPITDGSAWVGNNPTGEIAPYAAFSGSKTEASWLPDEVSARAWRIVSAKAK